uniref:Uncharacterized protein n=1 Tax=Anguilla anguilla TaxID=7936 RepID=A0A0E9TZ23_ANGAN
MTRLSSGIVEAYVKVQRNLIFGVAHMDRETFAPAHGDSFDLQFHSWLEGHNFQLLIAHLGGSAADSSLGCGSEFNAV